MATYEVVLSQRLNGTLCQMTFNYNKLTSPAGVVGAPAQIAAAFGELVLPKIMALQSNLVTNESVRCRDLGAPPTAATLEAGGGASGAKLPFGPPPRSHPAPAGALRRGPSECFRLSAGLDQTGPGSRRHSLSAALLVSPAVG